MPTELLVIDALMAIVGLVLSIVYCKRKIGNHGSLWAQLPDRPNRLLPELVAVPLLAFVCLHLFVTWLFTAVMPEQDTQVQVTLVNVAVNLGVGIVCLALAQRSIEGGLYRFLVGHQRPAVIATWGVVTLLMCLPWCWSSGEAAVFVLTHIDPTFIPPRHEVLELLGEAQPQWLTLLLWGSAVIVAPICEEAFFRGICQTALNRLTHTPMISVMVMSVLFGLAHASQPQVILPLAVLGLFLGYAYERSGSLLVPIITHSAFNLRTMVYVSYLQSQP